jgi:hypothetical protein
MISWVGLLGPASLAQGPGSLRLSKGNKRCPTQTLPCYSIDKFSLKSITYSNIPQPGLSGKCSPNYGFPCTVIVGTIDGQYPDIRDHPRYTVYMRVYVRYLRKLYR